VAQGDRTLYFSRIPDNPKLQNTWKLIPEYTYYINGQGNFLLEIIISTGIDIHESQIADLDGDGDLDILGKPYNGDAPRLDIWLQNGTGECE
jgi:hypothetical protein